jgi:hypothetical protein
MAMNKFSVFGISMLLSLGVAGQTVSVKTQDEAIDGAKVDNVQVAWVKFLRDYGKVRQGDHITVLDPVINGLTFAKHTIHANATEKGDNTIVWLGIKPGDWESSDVSRINHELEKMVKQFGLKYYRDKIQVQIDEAQQATDAVEKQKLRMLNQGKDLANSLINNGKQKVDLEKAIEANKLEKMVLEVKIANNKKAQDSLLHAGEQIQKMKVVHQERQAKVN